MRLNESDAKTVKLEKVEVTGSRIRTLVGEQTALPLINLDQIELEQRGVARLADLRWAVPQLGASIGFNDNLTTSGTSRAQTVSTSFALRGISGNSTLVLIDGRRIPHTGQEAPGGAGGREDFNVDGIPVSAIERIDILPQGASAIYGSDAVTGVVNIILKKNYSGNELQFSYDNAFQSDVAAKTLSLTGGYKYKKLSLFYTLSRTEQNSLAASDRWWTQTNNLLPYGASYNYNIYMPYSGPGTLANGNPFGTALYLSKVFYDLPSPKTISEQNNSGVVFGAEGTVLGGWHYDAGVNWARNIVKDQAYNNGFDSTKLAAAVTAGVILTYDSSATIRPRRSMCSTSRCRG